MASPCRYRPRQSEVTARRQGACCALQTHWHIVQETSASTLFLPVFHIARGFFGQRVYWRPYAAQCLDQLRLKLLELGCTDCQNEAEELPQTQPMQERAESCLECHGEV